MDEIIKIRLVYPELNHSYLNDIELDKSNRLELVKLPKNQSNLNPNEVLEAIYILIKNDLILSYISGLLSGATIISLKSFFNKVIKKNKDHSNKNIFLEFKKDKTKISFRLDNISEEYLSTAIDSMFKVINDTNENNKTTLNEYDNTLQKWKSEDVKNKIEGIFNKLKDNN